jgi:hypothetical protein
VPTVLKSRSLNFLEPSRPLQACNGIVLSFIFIPFYYIPKETGHLLVIIKKLKKQKMEKEDW